MKHILFLVLILGFALPSAMAQSDSSFTLKECIDYALANNAQVQNAMLDQKIAKAKVGEVRSYGLPQVSGTLRIMDNPQLQKMFLRKEMAMGFAFPGMRMDSSGGVAIMDNLFQVRSMGDANIGLTQLIFDGSYLVGLQAASTYKELSEKSLKATKEEVAEAVTKAYYLHVINQERIKLLDINIARLDTTLRQIKVLHETGFAEAIDVSRMEVAYNNLVTEKQKIENFIIMSELLLKFQMGYPIDQKITLEESIASINAESLAADTSTGSYENRTDYSLLQTQLKLNKLQLKNVRAGYLPSLGAFATAGMTRHDTKIGYIFSNKWYSYNYVGLNLSVPIFDGLNKYYRASQAKLEVKKTENTIESFKSYADLETKNALISLQNNLKALKIQERNLELSKEVARVAKIKFESGVGSNLELVSAEADYKAAQINYYDALYNAIISKIELDVAKGNLIKE
ncbi:MAG TPA: TolC family protein [Cytophagaceae bacterium]